MRGLLLLIAAGLVGGCYSTTTLEGDVGGESPRDTPDMMDGPADVATDERREPIADDGRELCVVDLTGDWIVTDSNPPLPPMAHAYITQTDCFFSGIVDDGMGGIPIEGVIDATSVLEVWECIEDGDWGGHATESTMYIQCSGCAGPGMMFVSFERI